jgi:hypothetical protein
MEHIRSVAPPQPTPGSPANPPFVNLVKMPFGFRVVTTLLVAASIALSCTCVSSGLNQDTARATIVFRGAVTNIKELPLRPESSRKRFAVTFAVSEHWKGTPSKEVTLHIIEPGTDCVGARFAAGKEYIVFAESQRADDHWLDKHLWYGWLDLLPKGSSFLTANNFCDSTAEVKQARKTLRQLGRGQKPGA